MTGEYMERPRVMVVDNSPQNLKLLENMLTARGYCVLALPNGTLALRAAKKAPPDIILLDIDMPDMDGYEVCRHINESPALAEIPVIFISALDSAEDKIRAFKAGGVDYITKPFNIEEAGARIRSHLKIAYLKKQLANSHQQLEQQVAKRTAELVAVNCRLQRLETLKNDFLNMICCEMRTPVNGMSKLLEAAFEHFEDSTDLSQFQDLYQQSRERIDELLDDAMILTSLKEGCFETRPTLEAVTALVEKLVRKHKIELVDGLNLKENLSCPAQYEWLTKAVNTLAMVAACFSRTNKIRMSFSYRQECAHIRFHLDNIDIDNHKSESFFDIMSSVRASSYAENLGLAPVTAERIISLYGGRVKLSSEHRHCGSLDVEIPIAEN